MSEKNTPGVTGQDPTSAPINPDSDLAKILAAIRGIGTRLDVLEQRFEYLDRNCLEAIGSASEPVPEDLIEQAPDTDRAPPHVPSVALRSDGAVLLALAYVEGADIAGREQWTGIVLSHAEACDLLDGVSDGADDAASHVGGHIIARSKKAHGGSDE